MTQSEYLDGFRIWLQDLATLNNKKNSDYSTKNDAFKNLKQIEILSNGAINLEAGILTRMSDKISRIGTLLFQKTREVNDETLLDTLDDLAIYSGILKIYLKSKNDKN